MDGQCQDEFRHCTDPGSDQEWINITFRWIKQHVASCSFLRTGVACCLPTCARGFSLSGTELVEKGGFRAFWLLFGALCILGVLALLVISLVCTRLGCQRCASCCTRPVGGVWWRHYLCYTWGVCWVAQKKLPVKKFGMVFMVSSCICWLQWDGPSGPTSDLYFIETASRNARSCQLNRQIPSFSTLQAPFRAFGRCINDQSCGLTPFHQAFATSRVLGSWSHSNSAITKPNRSI